MFPGPRQLQEKDSTSPPVVKISRIIFKSCKWESLGTDVVLPVLYPNRYLTNGG